MAIPRQCRWARARAAAPPPLGMDKSLTTSPSYCDEAAALEYAPSVPFPRQVAVVLLLSLLASGRAGAGEDAAAEAGRAFSGGEYERAVSLLDAAIAKDARDGSLHYWLARSQYELGHYDEAGESAQRAVVLDPDNSEYHQWLGRALGRRAERAGWISGFSLARKVCAEFETAVRLAPGNLRAQRDLIEFYSQAPGIVGGGDEKARRQVEALAAIDAVEGHLARAGLWANQKKPDRADAEYRAVIAARPERAGPYLEAADFYEQRRDAAHMEEAVEAGAAIDPQNAQLLYYRGVAAILTGGRDAERLLRRYLDTVPPRSDLPSKAAAREWLGQLYERQGRIDAAADEYRSALRLERGRRVARDALRRLGKS